VVAVGGDNPVALLIGVDKARRHRLLAGIDVEVAPDLALSEASLGGFFKDPDQNHLFVQIQEMVVV
jgi:hypothetical protein